jgi:RimK-like ATP-grasp domain
MKLLPVYRNIIVSPWKGGTPRRLAKSLNFKVVAPSETIKVQSRKLNIVLNWGCTIIHTLHYNKLYNFPPVVRVAANKLSTFKALSNARIPVLEFTEDDNQAKDWNSKHTVVGHHDLHGHAAKGLSVFKKGAGIPDEEAIKIDLWTKYFPKKVEARVHVVRVADDHYRHMYLEKKRVKADRYEEFNLEEIPSTYIRTYDRGWVFCREVTEDAQAVTLAVDAAKSIGLDYCAVDILINDKGERRIGEINTAPGLEGKSLEFYSTQLLAMMGNHR